MTRRNGKPAPAARSGAEAGGCRAAVDRAALDRAPGGTADPATGLTNLGAREYNPAEGAFISPDPLVNPSDPQDLDPYAYASDNPSTNEDPSGRMACDGDVCGSIQYFEAHPNAGNPGGDGSGRAPADSDGTAGSSNASSPPYEGGDGMLEGHLGIEPTGPTAGLYREMTRSYIGGWTSFLGGIGDSLVSLLDLGNLAANPVQGALNMATGNTFSDRHTSWLARHGVQTGPNSEYGSADLAVWLGQHTQPLPERVICR